MDRKDGYNVVSSIPLKLQKKVERIIDENQQQLNAKEIIVGIMESKSGKILSLASSARFNPNTITKNDYPNLNASAVEYSYEPGSIIKPIIYSILLDKNLINPNEKIIEELIEKGGELEFQDSRGRKPISFAATCAGTGPLKVLIDN